MLHQTLIQFFRHESAIGVLLIVATLTAIAMSNSGFFPLYEQLVALPVVVSFGEFTIAKPLLLWINDGLMAVFFFMVGLEVKREVLEGSLSHPARMALPAFAAIGGMVVPSLIYIYFNRDDPAAMSGWAIPAATDIAFALGILTLLGSRVPAGLKLFLLALAIIDDLGAIVIIAAFYTSELSFMSLVVALFCIFVLIMMNRRGIINHTYYLLVGLVLWTAMLKSGVHATLAGVLVGLVIPLKNNKAAFYSLEHSLHGPVNYLILPLFAFANAGISFSSASAKDLFDNITLGISLGLFFGKQAGVFLFSFLAVKLRIGSLPEGVTWLQVYGVSLLSGIGFTMSLFIGSLAFECTGGACFDLVDERMGILIGSLFSGVAGYLVLRLAFKKPG